MKHLQENGGTSLLRNKNLILYASFYGIQCATIAPHQMRTMLTLSDVCANYINIAYGYQNQYLEHFSYSVKGEDRDEEASKALPPPSPELEGPMLWDTKTIGVWDFLWTFMTEEHNDKEQVRKKRVLRTRQLHSEDP